MDKNLERLIDLTDITSVRGNVVNHDGKHALLQRTGDSQGNAGLWELVGGKVKLEETLPEALEREGKQELGVPIRYGGPIMKADERIIADGEKYLGRTIHVHFAAEEIVVDEMEVEIDPRTHQAIAWVALEELLDYEVTQDTDTVLQRLNLTSPAR